MPTTPTESTIVSLSHLPTPAVSPVNPGAPSRAGTRLRCCCCSNRASTWGSARRCTVAAGRQFTRSSVQL